MRKLILISMLVVCLALLFTLRMGKDRRPIYADSVQVVSFAYSCSGSAAYDCYSFIVESDASTGEAAVRYELCAGHETYELPVDAELMRQLTALVADHDLNRWNNFDRHDSRIMDGKGFRLDVRFADGVAISASGENRFPKGYSDAADAIDDLFIGYLKKKGIVPLMEQ